jgi:glutamyl/glutaminyl-tRNA synthetase
MKDRVTFVKEIVEKGRFFFENPEYTSENLAKISKAINQETVNATLAVIANASDETLEADLKEVAVAHNQKVGDYMKFLRISIVGELSGPSVPELILLLGKEATTKRIKTCFSKLG